MVEQTKSEPVKKEPDQKEVKPEEIVYPVGIAETKETTATKDSSP